MTEHSHLGLLKPVAGVLELALNEDIVPAATPANRAVILPAATSGDNCACSHVETGHRARTGAGCTSSNRAATVDLNRLTAADARALVLLAREQERIPAACVAFHLTAPGSPLGSSGHSPADDGPG